MKSVLSFRKRWSTKSKKDAILYGTGSSSSTGSFNSGITFGYSSITGKYHKNEDVIVPPCPVTDALCATTSRASSLSNAETEMKTDDSMCSLEPAFNLDDVLFAAVFDGHGGSECPKFMSEVLPAHLAQAAADRAPTSFQELCNSTAVKDAFKRSEDDFYRSQEYSPSGACVVSALIHGNSFLLAWLGDCRAVLCSGGNVTQLTSDHRCSNQDEFNRIVQNGGRVINDRVMGVLSPTRAFGDNDIKKCFPGQVLAEPSVLCFSIEEAEVPTETSFLILASDGVFDTLTNDRACEVVAKALEKSNNNPSEAAKRLCEAAARANPDDVSATVILWNHKQRLAASHHA